MKSYRLFALSVGLPAALAVGLAACAPTPTPEPPPAAGLASKWLTYNWPPNDGCDGAPAKRTLAAGTEIDRFGGDGGNFFSVPGTPYEQRSLPYDQSKLAYNVYVVRQPLDVEACRIAPWFDAKGGGEQFKTGPRAYELKAKGVIAPR